MRDLSKVIDYLRTITPSSETDVHGMFNDLQRKLGYTSPECTKWRWRELCVGLDALIGKPDCDWKKAIRDVVTDRVKLPAIESPAKESQHGMDQ